MHFDNFQSLYTPKITRNILMLEHLLRNILIIIRALCRLIDKLIFIKFDSQLRKKRTLRSWSCDPNVATILIASKEFSVGLSLGDVFLDVERSHHLDVIEKVYFRCSSLDNAIILNKIKSSIIILKRKEDLPSLSSLFAEFVRHGLCCYFRLIFGVMNDLWIKNNQ